MLPDRVVLRITLETERSDVEIGGQDLLGGLLVAVRCRASLGEPAQRRKDAHVAQEAIADDTSPIVPRRRKLWVELKHSCRQVESCPAVVAVGLLRGPVSVHPIVV
jgi:hypothetical protein